MLAHRLLFLTFSRRECDRDGLPPCLDDQRSTQDHRACHPHGDQDLGRCPGRALHRPHRGQRGNNQQHTHSLTQSHLGTHLILLHNLEIMPPPPPPPFIFLLLSSPFSSVPVVLLAHAQSPPPRNTHYRHLHRCHCFDVNYLKHTSTNHVM